MVDEPRLLDGRLKPRHLVLVAALSRQGSVVGAAAALHITQPVATRRSHELEGILGVSLYERGLAGALRTSFGTAFADHARAVLAQCRRHAGGRTHAEPVHERDGGEHEDNRHRTRLAVSRTSVRRAAVVLPRMQRRQAPQRRTLGWSP